MLPSLLVERDGIVVVVVLYRPDQATIAHVGQLSAAGHSIVAVSNSVTPEQADQLREMPGVVLIDNAANIGLARALNQGIACFLASQAALVLLLDQDSRLEPGAITSLKASAGRLRAQGFRLGCVAPRLVDRKSLDAVVGAAHESMTVATSGSVLTREALLDVGLMWEELFIDCIDHEWCFRARAMGYGIIVENDIVLTHDMGDSGVRIGNRYRPIHRSPVRHYHILRNTLWLQRCGHIPLRWRLGELAKSGYRAPIYLAVSTDRWATVRAIGRAIVDGVVKPSHLPVVPA